MNIRHRLESVVGAAQYVTLTRGVARVSGFRADVARLPETDDMPETRVPFLARVRGWGAPIVLVHGFGGDKESWLLMARAIRRRAMVVIPDLPGYGAASDITPERASAKHQAAVLRDLLDHLGFARAHVVGSSMGGGIALRFARDYPERASSLTLVGSVGPVVVKSEVLQALDRGENPLILDEVDRLDTLMALIAERPFPTTRAMRRYLGEQRVARRDALHGLFRGWDQPRDGEGVPHDLESIRAPALVIHGLRDRVIDVSTGRALAERLPGARLVTLEGVGHVPQMEAPVRVARELDAFVEEVESRRGR